MSIVMRGRRAKSLRVIKIVVKIDEVPYVFIHKVVSELGGSIVWRGMPSDTLELKVVIHKKKLREFKDKLGDRVVRFEVEQPVR